MKHEKIIRELAAGLGVTDPVQIASLLQDLESWLETLTLAGPPAAEALAKLVEEIVWQRARVKLQREKTLSVFAEILGLPVERLQSLGRHQAGLAPAL